MCSGEVETQQGLGPRPGFVSCESPAVPQVWSAVLGDEKTAAGFWTRED